MEGRREFLQLETLISSGIEEFGYLLALQRDPDCRHRNAGGHLLAAHDGRKGKCTVKAIARITGRVMSGG